MPCPRTTGRAVLVLLACAVASCSERVLDKDGGYRVETGDPLFCGTQDFRDVDVYGEPGGRPAFSVPWGTMTTVEEITRKGVWNPHRTRAGFLRCTVQRNGSPARVWLYSENVYVADAEGRVDALRCGQYERSLEVGQEIYAGRQMPQLPSNPLLPEPHPRCLRSAKIRVPSDTKLVVEEVVNGFVKVTYRDKAGAHVGWLTAKHVARTSGYWFFQGTFIFLMIALFLGFNLFIIPGFLGSIFPPILLVRETTGAVLDRLWAGINRWSSRGGRW